MVQEALTTEILGFARKRGADSLSSTSSGGGA